MAFSVPARLSTIAVALGDFNGMPVKWRFINTYLPQSVCAEGKIVQYCASDSSRVAIATSGKILRTINSTEPAMNISLRAACDGDFVLPALRSDRPG